MKKKQLTFNQARKRALIIALLLSLCVFAMGCVFLPTRIELLVEIPMATFIIIFAISFILLSQNCSDIKRSEVSYDPEWEKRVKEKFAKKFKQNPNAVQNDDLDECLERLQDDLHEQHFSYHRWDIY